jgi:hypothetical protein
LTEYPAGEPSDAPLDEVAPGSMRDGPEDDVGGDLTDEYPPTIHLHIGTMKSGTTFVQRRLKANSEEFARDGVLVPSSGGWVLAATRDVLGISAPDGPESTAGRWDDLRSQVLDWRGAASVISMEFFSTTDQEGATRVVESLQPAPVEIVITARDLARVIPSAWQESTQNGSTFTFDEYLDSVVADDGHKPGSKFWRQQDLVRIIETWSAAVGPDHIRLVTVPPTGAGPDLLWERFCAAIGLRGKDYANDIEESRANYALGHPSAEFMRRFNEELRGTKVTRAQYIHYAKRMIARRSLNQRRSEAKVVLPVRYREHVLARGERMVDEVASTGVHVIGDLRELVPAIAPDTPEVHQVTSEEILDAAVDTISVLLQELTKAFEQGRRHE